jgi:hypothetical protein
MTSAQLIKLATLAFGPRWKTALKEKSGISREQIWRYADERTPISEEAAARMKRAIRKQFEKQQAQIAAAMKLVDA